MSSAECRGIVGMASVVASEACRRIAEMALALASGAFQVLPSSAVEAFPAAVADQETQFETVVVGWYTGKEVAVQAARAVVLGKQSVAMMN